ncbi:HRDC domain-containing protein [Halomonas denitrificans]|nr:HRDC domain-containing protein [Halomonas denitrificans]
MSSTHRRRAPGEMLDAPRFFIDRIDSLEDHASEIEACHAVGIDTEFVRERTFFPQPGLLQFSDGNAVWLIDPVALGEVGEFVSRLAGWMRNPGRVKILHSVGEDFEVIERVCGALPEPLFDTQIAAAMLGMPLQLKYETLAEERLGVTFPGGLGRNNWLRRPLPDAWMAYAAHDVIGLPELMARLAEGLDRAGRLGWHTEDCARLVERARRPVDPLTRIRGADRLDDDALARLDRMARWRDEEARRRDLPRTFIAADPVLLEIARRNPRDPSGLEGIDKLKPGAARRFGPTLIECCRTPTPDFVRPPELQPLTREDRDAVTDLQKTVRTRAEELDVDPALLASKRELTRIVRGERPDWLDGWRGDLFGAELEP